MQQKCDIYFSEPTRTDRLKFVSMFDKNFRYEEGKVYVGYLGVNVDRVKLVSIVSDLRKSNIACFSAPIEYRDNEKLSLDAAIVLANEYAKSIENSVALSSMLKSKSPPVYWAFDLKNEGFEGKAGGVVMVDRIDGHIWSQREYEEYMYDFNNIL